MKTMRSITHVVEAFGSGTLEVVRLLANHQAERGVRVQVLHGRRPESPDDPHAGFSERVADISCVFDSRRPSQQLRSVHRLRMAVEEFAPDLVHAHSSFSGVGVAAARMAAPTVYTPHGYAFLRRDVHPLARTAFRVAERMIGGRMTAVIGCSESEAALARSLGLQNVGHVQNGIPDLDSTAPSSNQSSVSRARVVASGRIGAQRQPAETARILASLRDVAEVGWLGAAPDRADLEPLVSAGIPVSGWLQRTDLLDELSRASIYLHWTAWDGLPLAILEAIARGAVVIASDTPPNREVLGDRYVCRDTHEAAELARMLVGRPDALDASRREQAQRARRFSASRMIRRWDAAYDSLMNGEAPAR